MSASSLRAAYAKHILHGHLLPKYHQHCGAPPIASHGLPSKTIPISDGIGGRSLQILQLLGIIGAGAAGLAVALVLREMGYSDFDILGNQIRWEAGITPTASLMIGVVSTIIMILRQ